MKKYNYFQTIYMSFYSHDLYRDVAKNWGVGVVLYLLLLLLICWGSMMFKYQPMINKSFNAFVNVITPQVPEMSIKEGIVTTPEDRPYIIKDPEKDETIAIIDTSGQYSSMKDVPEKTVLLMTKDTIYYVDNRNTLRVNKLSNTLNLDIVPDKIKSVAVKLVNWLWLIILPVLLITSLVYRIVQALFYGLIGKIFSVIAKVPLTYAQNLKLAMIAVTPAIILATVLDWFNVSFRFEWLVCFLITMAYLVCAINSNRSSSDR